MEPNLGAITYERKAVQTGWIRGCEVTSVMCGCPLRVKDCQRRCDREDWCGHVSGLVCDRIGRGPR
jgi:hypothetical protein